MSYEAEIFMQCSLLEVPLPEELSPKFQSCILDSAMTENAMVCFFCMTHRAVAWSIAGGVMICYILPVLWMASCFAIMGPMGTFCLCAINLEWFELQRLNFHSVKIS